MTGLDTWFGIPKIAPDTEHKEVGRHHLGDGIYCGPPGCGRLQKIYREGIYKVYCQTEKVYCQTEF